MCLDDLSRVIKNRHQDKQDNFTYYQIDIKAKNDSDPSNARQYLFDYDCKVELYYVDVKIVYGMESIINHNILSFNIVNDVTNKYR